MNSSGTTSGIVVIDLDGVRGTTTEKLLASTEPLEVHFKDGRKVIITREMLLMREDGHYALNQRVAELQSLEQLRVPVIEEEVTVDKRWVEDGTVRITKQVTQQDINIDELLRSEQVDVQHVTVNRYVDQPENARYEGDTLIIPLMEEVLVVEKRLLVREEVHIVKRRTMQQAQDKVTLRREDVFVDRDEELKSQ